MHVKVYMCVLVNTRSTQLSLPVFLSVVLPQLCVCVCVCVYDALHASSSHTPSTSPSSHRLELPPMTHKTMYTIRNPAARCLPERVNHIPSWTGGFFKPFSSCVESVVLLAVDRSLL